MKARKKILMVIPTLSAGGSERFVSILFSYLDRTRFDVKLIVLNSAQLFYSLPHTEDIFFLKKKDVRSSLLAILKIIRKEKPQVILSTITSLNILLSFIRVFYPRFKLYIRESTILSIHFRGIRYGLFYETMILLFYRFSDRIICQSQDMLQDLHNRYYIKKGKMIVINNPVNPDQFTLKEKSKNSRPMLITVARLDGAKGYDRILRSLALVKVDFEYVIVGDFTCNEYNKLLLLEFDHLVSELGLHQKIRRVGVSKTPQDFLRQANVYLHGSYYEGFPNALLEAGSVGLPVVSFKSPGIGEILQDELNGFVVENNNLQAFAEAVTRATVHPFEPSHIRDQIISKFGVSTIIDKYQDLLESNS